MTAPTSPPHTPPAAAQNPRPANSAWIAVLLTLTGLSLAAFLTLRASAPAKDSPIHIAAKTNDVATLKQLLAADPNLANAKTEGMGATPLHWAAAAGKLEAVRVLLEYHANPNLVHKIGGTALHAAVRYNHGPVVEYLLDHGANLNGRDAGGRTALFLAVFEKKPEMVKILLQRQADTTIPDHEWVTPLQMARIMQNKIMIDLLTPAGAPAKDSPIHIAAKTNDIATLKTLLQADPTLANAKTQGMDATPIHWAAAAGHLEAVQVLLHHGSDPNLVHKIGGTALHAAVRYNHGPVVEYLLDHGANLNGRDAGGRTALFLAVFEKKPEMVKILLQRQADTTIPDHEWVTPLQMARIMQNKIMIDLLTAAGATQ